MRKCAKPKRPRRSKTAGRHFFLDQKVQLFCAPQLLAIATLALNPFDTPPDLDMPVFIHDEVAALEVAVHDGRAVSVQVQHSTRRLGASRTTSKTEEGMLAADAYLPALASQRMFAPPVRRAISVVALYTVL